MSSFPSGFTVYTFASVSFIRVIEGENIQPWFYAEGQFQKDVTLGGTKVYLDVGATVYPQMVFRASCLSAADRLALTNALWSSGTLSNTRGHSATVVLVKAVPVNVGNYQSWLIDLSFELLPS